jgi:nitrate/nitrite transporter NarK
MLGIWTDQYGGRLVYTPVMFSAAVATWLLTYAYDYPTFFLAALGVGIAGGSFAVGIAYVSRWYPTDKRARCLGLSASAMSVPLSPNSWRRLCSSPTAPRSCRRSSRT